MFVDFEKTFSKRNQKTVPIPKPLINYLNKSLPKDLHYESAEDGTCFIKSDTDEVTISGLVPVLSDEDKKILGNKYTLDDLDKYLYNSQKTIELVPSKDNIITINGEDISFDKLIKKPFDKFKTFNHHLFVYPSPLPKPVDLEVKSDSITQIFKIRQVPYPSVNEIKMESDSTLPFHLAFIIDTKTGLSQIFVSLNLQVSKTISDFYNAATLYNEFLSGKVTILGKRIDSPIDKSYSKEFDKKSLLFWNKVLQIENELNVSFIPPKEDISFETICLVERIYQSLINHKPIISPQYVNSIHGEFAKNERDILEKIEKDTPCAFLFEVQDNLSLFGVDFNLYGITINFNVKIKNIKVDGNKYKLELEDFSKEKQHFAALLYFKDAESMKLFRENTLDINDIFTNAKDITEYIN